MPIALARLGTHGGGPPLDLHRGTFDVDERAIGVGVRLLARTALHALEADAGIPRGRPTRPHRRPAPGDTSARRAVDERREPDDESHRPADRLTRRAGADAEVPAEHEVPDDARARRGVRRRHPRPVARARRRRAAQGRPRGPARPGRGRAEPSPSPPASASRRSTPPRTPATCPSAVGVPGLRAVRARAPARARIRRAACPAAGTSASGTRTPTSPSTKEAIAADLENGVTSLWLVLGEGAIPVDSLGDVLADVLLDLAPVTVQGGLPAAEAFLSLVEGRTDLAPGGSLGLDPLGLQAASGEQQDLSGLADVARRAAAAPGPAHRRRRRHRLRRRRGVGGRGARLLAGGRGRLPAGAHRRRAVASTRRSASWSSATARAPTSSRPSPGCGPPAGCGTGSARSAARRPRRRAQRQHAVTSSVMTTKRDPWVNMLRTTVACFAAGVGGADAVTVQPFDAALGLPDAFSRRIARNTQTLLVEEGHLARVLDPAGGSWYVESLTDSLAQAAWDWFTEIERAGGLAAALDSGLVARPARRRLGRPRRSGWPPARTRSPASASSPTWPRSCPTARARAPARAAVRRAAAGAGRAGVRGAARPRRRRAAGAPGGLPGDDRPGRQAHRPGHVRRQPVPGRRPRDAVRGRRSRVSPRRATTVACICGTDKDYAESAAGLAAGAAGGRRDAGVAGRQAGPRRSTASTATCSPAATRSTCCATVHEQVGVQA